jgi:hypothetical protein
VSVAFARSGLVAFWDFAERRPPFETRAGVGRFPLRNGPGSDVRAMSTGPLGRAADFDGVGDYLVIAAGDVGELHLGRAGDACTVVAWIWRRQPGIHFVAGIWQEDDRDPRRQYGLFVSLPLYGGDQRVCGHVSRMGGPTPGYPYSRDYSATERTVPLERWCCVGFTYDGREALSYLDGRADLRPHYTDPLGNTYAKNPYRFEDGLNGTAADFTVGAVRLTGAMGNFLDGRLGGLAVYDRPLAPHEMEALHLASTGMSATSDPASA